MHFNYRAKIVKRYQKNPKTVPLFAKTPHAVAPFVLVIVASEIIVSTSFKVNIINFYTLPLSWSCNKKFMIMHSNIARPCVVVM